MPTNLGLSARTRDSIEILFHPEDRELACAVLFGDWGSGTREIERCQIAALKLSDGNLAKLEEAVKLGRIDYRDLIMAAGFGDDITARLHWQPKPASEPSGVALHAGKGTGVPAWSEPYIPIAWSSLTARFSESPIKPSCENRDGDGRG
jgi:hypothetical protein